MVAAVIGSALAVTLLAHTVINGLLLRRASAPRTIEEPVAILVPCRNEAAHVIELLQSLQAQRYLQNWSIYLLDDASEDQTAALAFSVADQRTHVIKGAALPEGWLGKPFACQQLAEHALDASVLVFIDADVRLAPTAVSQAISTMRDLELHLVSPYPSQIAMTWSERLTQPLLHWSWLATLPLRIAERSSRATLTAANGQFLVIDASAYRTSDGHRAIRDCVLDDMELLKSMKRHGFHGVVVDGSEIASCRMYTNWREIERGYTKWLWAAFGSPLNTLVAGVVLTLIYIAPLFYLTSAWPLALTSFAAGVLSRMISAVRTKGRILDAFAHPLSILALIVLMALSWSRKLRGSTSWKGRVLPT